MTQTFKEIVTTLLTNSGLKNEFFHSETPEHSKYVTEGDDTFTFLAAAEEAGVTFEHEDNHGGEGQGGEYWSVYKFTKGSESVLVKFDGYYQSYTGAEFDDWYFVESKPVEVVQYFRSK